jgi:prolyl-tRNA synthetase
MNYSQFFIPTVKEVPKDATIQSHILMIRAGLIKKLTSGIYSFLPLGTRVIKKIEQIVREEMNNIGCNEFLLPVLIPGQMWKTSNRWFSMGPELFRLKDRNAQDLVLAPTHEEVFTSILKDHIKSYRDLPLSVYHIGFKFRDEVRPRFGVMRGKTFIMKDAYSFHRQMDEDSLDETYGKMSTAYRKIFQRCGLKTIPVTADSGTMGGSQSEEFMVPSTVGEEFIVRCGNCGYVANREKASAGSNPGVYNDSGDLEMVETPDIKTIEALSEFLLLPSENLIKTLVFKTSENKLIVALIRGDLDINETKLKNHLGVPEIEPASYAEALEGLGVPLGFAGPIGLGDVTVLADLSVQVIKGGATGANKKDFHYINVNAQRDFTPERYLDLRLVKEGDACPDCGNALDLFKGIELGHIFKLGDKYSKAFSVYYLDEDGSMKLPIMGCYGIGIERTAAAIIEQNHDKYGIVWPVTVAPFHVHVLPIRYKGDIKKISDQLVSQLEEQGVEVFLDDRDIRAGVKFNDADLIGIPFRINIGDRGLQEGSVEFIERRTRKKDLIKLDHMVHFLKDRIDREINAHNK